jgi:hypothetical protein
LPWLPTSKKKPLGVRLPVAPSSRKVWTVASVPWPAMRMRSSPLNAMTLGDSPGEVNEPAGCGLSEPSGATVNA